MFEGLVRNLILGYLGRYIKDIQKEQLKITLWNEEVLLENVELILEAFDYLQLPFALKQGRVGRLSIKIPWKKLGWDPIIITIEDVFVSACQRDDQEWSADAVERREFSAKRAKLAAAELAKLSRRVCENQAGQSFVSYITAKILEGIQVSIRNVHILYRDMLTNMEQTVIGLRFSSLSIMKHNLTRFSSGKVKSGQVNKIVEIRGLEIYCSTCRETLDLVVVTNGENSKFPGYTKFEGNSDLYMLAPVDISMSLMVNRSGSSRNDAPQYSINIKLTELVMSLSDNQLGQILTLWEYLCICELRKMYGRYRPWDKPLSRKYHGWQVAWWHYAQQCVLSDVRRKLKKNSWKYFGQRLNCRRKYVNLYKTKLKNLREEQMIDYDVLQLLEQMEKESDLEDILNYRGIAESELQEFLEKENFSLEGNGSNFNIEKQPVDERAHTRPRGWLNWLSRGMLGAGGTDDSSQFSGVVSDEVIKDIYEATKFKPASSPDGSTFGDDDVVFSEVNFLIHKVSTTLWIRDCGQAAAKLNLEELIVDCKLWEETLVITSSVNSAIIINQGNKQKILRLGKAAPEKDLLDIDKPAVCIQLDSSSAKQEVNVLVEVTEALEITYDSEFLENVMKFYDISKTFIFHHERVMLSLNEFEDVQARLLWKAEYILSGRQRVAWDVSFGTIKINVMSRNASPHSSELVFQIGAFHFTAIDEHESASGFEDELRIIENLKSSIWTSDISTKIELQHLYDHFELQVTDLEVKVLIPTRNQITVVEKMSASTNMTSCIIPDESVLLQLKVDISIQSVCAHFSPSIYLLGFSLLDDENRRHLDFDSETSQKARAPGIKSKGVTSPETVSCAVLLNMKSVSLHVDLENDKEMDCSLLFNLEDVNVRYSARELQECCVSSRTLRIISYSTDTDDDSLVICSSGNPFSAQYAKQQDISVDHGNENGTCSEQSTYSGQCFILLYEESKSVNRTSYKFGISLSDVDCHCYPHIIRLLLELSEKILGSGASSTVENSFSESPISVNCFGFEKFGFSNLSETGSTECTSIAVENFPFVTIDNVSSHRKWESSLIQLISGWRNNLKLRDSQIRNPELSARELRTLHVPNLEPRSGKDEMVLSNDGDTDLLIDLNVSRIRVHFHDSSSIIGTVSLTTSRSFISSCGDFLDMLFSIEGLSLCSSWWMNNIQETLWGPSLGNISPILNLRVTKYQDGPLRSHCRISLSIQHVSCVLPPEFLAAIIGYFSLSDWYTEVNHTEMENSTTISYIFEIVDSAISAPAEECDSQMLKLVIPHFYGSFILDGCSHNVLKDIPAECSVAGSKIAQRNQCLNLHGWQLSLSFLSSNRDELKTSSVDRTSKDVYETFIASFSADLWVLIPAESGISTGSSSASTCVMSRVHNCQLIAKGGYIFSGFEALLKIVDQFSLIDIESKCFRTDIIQFRHLKKSMKENGTFVSEAATVLVETRCSIDLLSIQVYHADVVSPEPVVTAEMKFVFSASFINEITQFLAVSFSRLALVSNLSSFVLAECTSSSPISSVLDIDLSISDGGEKGLSISLPSLDVWLHLSDWTVVINLFTSYIELAKTSINSVSHVKPSLGPENTIAGAVDSTSLSKLSCSSPETMEQKDTLQLKSESLGVNIYIPVSEGREPFSKSEEPQLQGEKSYGGSFKSESQVNHNFLTISLQSRCSELIVNGDETIIRSHLGKINGVLQMFKGKSFAKSSTKLPVFQFSRVNIEAEIINKSPDCLHTRIGIQCDSLELWLSYQIFFFLKCMSFNSPGPVSAQSTLSSVDLNMKLKKISILLIDGRWSTKAPLLEALVRNFIFDSILSGLKLDCSVSGDLEVNYNNIRKVLWEPFVEPWKFQLNINRLHEESALLDIAGKKNIYLHSTEQLNLNVTDSFIEVIFRAIEMVKDALGFLDRKVLGGSQGLLNSPICEHVQNGKYAPYVLENLTSLPLVFHVCKGQQCARYRNDSVPKDGTFVNPGASHPIYISGTPEEQLLHHRHAHSSERLSDKQLNGTAHNYVIIQFEGTAVPSTPISMDLVGPSYFEVDFSKSSHKRDVNDVIGASKNTKAVDEINQTGSRSGFVVPVVCDVSVQRYCKLVRFYSTVILFNGTSAPIEVRFDIPFGLAPKILDPIHPGQEFPLPLHLAEAGRVRWRPLGQNVLWSEAHNLSNILASESRIGLLRSFVCYPSRPNSDPFRCCISVQQICFPPSVEKRDPKVNKDDKPEKYLIHQVTLSSPLVVRNFLPETLSLTLDCGGVIRTALLTEVESFFYHVDSSHDLEIAFNLHGFGPSSLKFPRTETFSGIAKVAGTKYSQSEILTFNPDFGNGILYVSVEKTMDAFSGAREICLYVPYLLYNCTSFPLFITDSTTEDKGNSFLIPSCYDFGERDLQMGIKDGLGILSSGLDFLVEATCRGSLRSFPKSHNVSSKNPVSLSGLIARKPVTGGGSTKSQASSSECNLLSRTKSNSGTSDLEMEFGKLQACMYAPDPNSSMTEKVVRVRRSTPEGYGEHMPKSSWSSPFFLVQPAGSTTVSVPYLSANAADVISVTSSAVAGQFSGKTRVITFQPRYVISNACSKDLYYKQKGTDSSLQLGVGQHRHIQWTDTLRELLLSVRFGELGWQWSGCFSPNNLGDTQVKMRNHVNSAVSMIRVEVQNADVSIRDEKIVGSLQGTSGTNLILLSDDDTGFMPYRIDNFSKERLRVYQQSCETFETIIQSYTSCPFAWDEPCCPHRLTVEVPGQRILGSYTLDHVRDYGPVHLSSTSEKPERTLVVSVHAEGAVKVLSVIDSSYHVLNDPNLPRLKEKRKHDQKEEVSDDFNEKISVSIPFIGISLMNSYPQELIFACAKKTRLDLLQSPDQQKFSLQIECLQIDNQLQNTQYPVILSFNRAHRSSGTGQTRKRSDNAKIKNDSVMQNTSDSICEPDFCLSAAKWRNKDASLVSFECISLRIADFHLQLDQEILLGLLDFYRATVSRSQIGTSLTSDMGFKKDSFALYEGQGYIQSNGEQFHPTEKTHFPKSGHLQPSVVPIGAPWQQIYLLARRQKKIYVEMFDLSPIKLTLSFSSTPWMLRNALLASGESVIHRGLVALADIEGAQIYLGQLNVTHHMASWDSIQDIIIRHYVRQLLQEMYKVFGSAGVIGNPVGFARSVSLGIKDFVSAPARNFLKSPAGLITGMAQGTSSLLSNTVYALSDAATQFSRAAHKGIVAFTFDDQAVAGMEKQQKSISSHNKGVVDEILEGLTGLLQSPIRGAEKHGLLGVISGVAMGMTGLVARPAASILDATGRTAQSIRNRSKLHQLGHHGLRVRLPRPLSRDLPLRPYSWEEAIGTTVLSDANDGKLKDENLIFCKMLKQGGKLVIVTQRLVLIINCSSLVDLGKPEFLGVPADPEWVIEAEFGLESVIHADTSGGVVHIVGSNSDPLVRQNLNPRIGGGLRGKSPVNMNTLPLYQRDLEFSSQEEAENFLQVLLSSVKEGKEHGWGNVYLLHQSNLK